MVCATQPRVGGGRAKKVFVLKYLNLDNTFSILDSFSNDGGILSTASKKINQKAQGKKR